MRATRRRASRTEKRGRKKTARSPTRVHSLPEGSSTMPSSKRATAAYEAAEDQIVDALHAVVARRGFDLRERGQHTGRGMLTTWTRRLPVRTDELTISFCWNRDKAREVVLGLSTSVPRDDGRLVDLDGQNVAWLLRRQNEGPVLQEAEALDGAEGVRPLVEALCADVTQALAWWDAQYGDEAGMLARLRATDRNGVGAASDAGRALVLQLERALQRRGVDTSTIAPAPIRRPSAEEEAREAAVLAWIERGGALFSSKEHK